MSRPRRHSPELIAAVRSRANDGMKAGAIAAELTTPNQPLNKNSVIGIANRHGIELAGKNGKAQPKPAYGFGTVQARAALKKPGPQCSWSCCGLAITDGGMFCYTHSRKGLL